jgi:purine-binding chemotaxis protein CheW
MTTTTLEKPANKSAASSFAQSRQLVTFYADDFLLGVDIDYVQEISRQVELTPVPGAPESICGVINLRGDVVTVLNLHHLLGAKPLAPGASWCNLILSFGTERVGICVDRVSDICTVPENGIVDGPSNLRSLNSRFIEGVYLRDDAVVVILDPIKLSEPSQQVC